MLHGLHPDPVLTRVNDALERVRPYLGSHAGGVELLGVDDEGIAHLQLQGSCDGCPSSALTVTNAIEDAILQAAPDVVAVEVDGMVEPSPSLLQIAPFAPHEIALTADPWHPLELDVPPRTIGRVAVAEEHLLVANLDGTLVAYLDRCPSCQDPVSDGALDGDVLTCSGCATAYDVRLAGRAPPADLQLVPVPLLPERGRGRSPSRRGSRMTTQGAAAGPTPPDGHPRPATGRAEQSASSARSRSASGTATWRTSSSTA